ncbi:hypothetical protein [Candidatus Odyssella thessalonicensis]|uniref:hypothetical protein n=1 Tax=Candidatus Odyssella thessalonicensis TaxID=84647 RepID=UPI000225BFC8|nr:hypothetical protein [Candidatus Odyssella thessalonicensis]
MKDFLTLLAFIASMTSMHCSALDAQDMPSNEKITAPSLLSASLSNADTPAISSELKDNTASGITGTYTDSDISEAISEDNATVSEETTNNFNRKLELLKLHDQATEIMIERYESRAEHKPLISKIATGALKGIIGVPAAAVGGVIGGTVGLIGAPVIGTVIVLSHGVGNRIFPGVRPSPLLTWVVTTALAPIGVSIAFASVSYDYVATTIDDTDKMIRGVDRYKGILY